MPKVVSQRNVEMALLLKLGRQRPFHQLGFPAGPSPSQQENFGPHLHNYGLVLGTKNVYLTVFVHPGGL